MDRNIFEFTVEGQMIKRNDSIEPVAKCRNLYKAHFNFLTEEWKGLKTALFAQGSYSKSQVIDENGDCLVPWEFFDSNNETFGYVSVYCGDLVTANRAIIKILKSGYQKSDASVEPTPDVYQQILQIQEETKQIAQSVRDDADSGKFIGPPGPKGPQGLPGIVVPTNGLFGMQIENGNLICYFDDEDTKPSLRIDENGFLIFGGAQ